MENLDPKILDPKDKTTRPLRDYVKESYLILLSINMI